jgi:hypothetical protein
MIILEISKSNLFVIESFKMQIFNLKAFVIIEETILLDISGVARLTGIYREQAKKSNFFLKK